jgi:hypothetical protein
MRNYTKCWLGSLKRRDHSEDLGVDKRIILKWDDLADDTDSWRALVNAIINLGSP